MILKNIQIIFLFVAYCECYHTTNQQVNPTGIKSYGGYIPDSTGQNEAASQFVSSQNYQPPLTPYQPYGWNFNQPTRTYGGVNVLHTRQQVPQQHHNHGQIGWVDNNYNNMGVNPMFNNFPFFPMPQIPFPQFQFPNFNFYPNLQPNYQQGNLPYPAENRMPIPPTKPPNIYIPPDNTQQTVLPLNSENTQTSTINRVDQNLVPNNNEFTTNNFFENTNDRQWTVDQELEWQATTMKPFFENTVPGLGCTLPAASIIGAKNVFSAIELLPLNVPIGKPILSCNATGLRQADVKVKNKIYSCKNGAIECHLAHNNNYCPQNILKCDLKNSRQPITCTNGTLVSDKDLKCATIQVGNPQSVLNCEFKDEEIDVRFQTLSTTRAPFTRSTTARIDSEFESTTTRAPIIPPTRRRSTTSRPASIEVNYDEDQQTLETNNRFENENFIVPEVKSAMRNIFPYDLFVKPSRNLLPPKSYLPPYESQASRDLVASMKGIFPMELLAISKSKNNYNDGISTTSSYDIRLSENININQNTNTNNNNDNLVGFKTQLSDINTRFFGGESENTQRPLHQQQDFRDRLIFSN